MASVLSRDPSFIQHNSFIRSFIQHTMSLSCQCLGCRDCSPGWNGEICSQNRAHHRRHGDQLCWWCGQVADAGAVGAAWPRAPVPNPQPARLALVPAPQHGSEADLQWSNALLTLVTDTHAMVEQLAARMDRQEELLQALAAAKRVNDAETNTSADETEFVEVRG